MIVTRTPFRVTLGGGGTDLPSFYEKHGGFIFAMGITRYMYVMFNRRAIDKRIVLHYTKAEAVDRLDDLRHELAREGLRSQGLTDGVEITSLADLPDGTGVGSSSCYLVGLLAALQQYRRDQTSLHDLAELACHIELNVLQKRIGKQDQYMAAFGGLTRLDISNSGHVSVSQIEMSAGDMADFVGRTHIYYTGLRRDALEVLSDQDTAMRTTNQPRHSTVSGALQSIRDLGYRIYDCIVAGNFDQWGQLLHEHWINKKKMSEKISVRKIDALYDELRQNYHVLGGKIIGAGGGGFLMLYCTEGSHKLEKFMASQNMPRLHYLIEPEGTKVVGSFSSGSFQPIRQ